MRWIAIALVGAARSASAQPPNEVVTPTDDKSLLDAYLVSVAATSGPCVVAGILGLDGHDARATIGGSSCAAGLVLGPTAGHWYAGERMTTGLALRLGGAAAVATLVVADPYAHHTETWFELAGAASLWATGFVWDAVTLPRAVHRANAVRLMPVVTSSGFGIAGAF
jgi:hypothetical protein